MQSPFKIFRKHQKAVLAFLAVMAIVCFTIGDAVLKMTAGALRGAPDVVVETNAGNLTQVDISNLRRQRRVANDFMFRAFRAAHPEFEKFPFLLQSPGYVQRFGPDTTDNLVFGWLLRHEAGKMGVVVDDAQIDHDIDMRTSKKLSSEQFRKILGEMQLRAKDLYDILRGELTALMAYRLTVPTTPPSPEQYWELYRQLNTQQKIEAAVLPIDEFARKMSEPSDADLKQFFEEHKATFDSSGDGEFRPGFRQPPRVRVQYLALSYRAIEEEVLKDQPVTDKDIEQYYELNKDIDRRFRETAPPEDTEETAPPKTEDEARPAPPAQPRDDGAPADPESQCGAADETKDEPRDDKSGADAQPAAQPPEAGKAAEEPGGAAPGAKAPPDKQPPAVRYKPLDDDLRSIIKDSLIRERVLARMQEKQSQAAEELRDVGLKLATSSQFDLTKPKPAESRRLIERAASEMQAIGKRFDMTFRETNLVSPTELSALGGIGSVREGSSEDVAQVQPRTIVDQVFENPSLCRVLTGINPEFLDLYVFWKVEDVPMHVPTFDEPGVKERVADAWKHKESLPVAKNRAEKLAELVRKSEQRMADVLSGQTVTGAAGGTAITVTESRDFSWFRESFAPNTGMREPLVQLDNPLVVPKAGNRFMQFVFDELKEKGVGATLNDDASAVCIVKVVSRKEADLNAFKNAPLFDPSSAYRVLAGREQQRQQMAYNRTIEEAYAVKWTQREDTSDFEPGDE